MGENNIKKKRTRRYLKAKTTIFFLFLSLTGGKNLDSSLGDNHSLLKLGRALSILGDGGPVIGPHLILPCTLIDHGLDCENVADLHDTNGLVASIVRNVGCAVEEAVDSMTTIRLDN